jgi:hypothetical protein
MKSTSHLSENHQSKTRPDVCLYEQASEVFLEFFKRIYRIMDAQRKEFIHPQAVETRSFNVADNMHTGNSI